MKFSANKYIRYFIIVMLVSIIIFLYCRFLFIREVVTIILVAFILAYALKPICNYFCKKSNLNRNIISIILLSSIFLAVFLIAISIIPQILNDDILNNVEGFINNLNNNQFLVDSNFISGFGNKIYDKINASILVYSSKLSEIMKILSRNLIAIIIVPIVAYYFLAHGKYLSDKIMLIFPVSQREIIKSFMNDIDKVLSRYVLIQIELSVIVIIMTFILLTVLGIRFALILAIINGLFNIIPYFGPILGMIPALAIALVSNPLKCILTFIGLGAIQQIEGNFIAPQVTASSTDIHPLIIIILLVLGEKLGGIIGMILIIPLFVILKVVYDDLDYYLF